MHTNLLFARVISQRLGVATRRIYSCSSHYVGVTTARFCIAQTLPLRDYSRRCISTKSNQKSADLPRRTCWRCKHQTSQTSLFCDNKKCATIQPVGGDVSYFDILLSGKPPSFQIDTGELRRNFLRLQQTVHPDSYSQKERAEHSLAEAQSSWINHAYSTLKDPLPRAQYLLKLHGSEIGEEDQITDPELLMEVMDTREDIEMAQSDEQMADIKRNNDAKTVAVIKDLAAAFDSGDTSRAKQLTNHLQYLYRVSQAVHAWEPGKPVVISH